MVTRYWFFAQENSPVFFFSSVSWSVRSSTRTSRLFAYCSINDIILSKMLAFLCDKITFTRARTHTHIRFRLTKKIIPPQWHCGGKEGKLTCLSATALIYFVQFWNPADNPDFPPSTPAGSCERNQTYFPVVPKAVCNDSATVKWHARWPSNWKCTLSGSHCLPERRCFNISRDYFLQYLGRWQLRNAEGPVPPLKLVQHYSKRVDVSLLKVTSTRLAETSGAQQLGRLVQQSWKLCDCVN